MTRHRLTNGLDVVLHVDRHLPLVAVNVVYQVGSADDPVGNRQLAHLTEHLMFRGSKHVARDTFFDTLRDAGAVGVNGRTHPWRTTYVESLPANQLPIALLLEADRMGHFPFMLRNWVIDEERDTVWNESIERRHDHAVSRIHVETINTLFPLEHPYHRVTTDDLKSISRRDVRRFADAYIGPGNATLILAGDLPDKTFETVARYFGEFEGGSPPPRPSLEVTLPGEQTRTIEIPTLQAPVVSIMWPSPAGLGPADADADVVAEILRVQGTPPGGSLASVQVFQNSRAGLSLFSILARGRPGADTDEMLEEIDAMLSALADGPSAVAVRNASKRRVLQITSTLHTLEGRAERIAYYVSQGKDPDWVAEDVARFSEVSPSSVARFMRTHLIPARRAVLHARPPASTARQR